MLMHWKPTVAGPQLACCTQPDIGLEALPDPPSKTFGELNASQRGGLTQGPQSQHDSKHGLGFRIPSGLGLGVFKDLRPASFYRYRLYRN